MSTVAKSQYRQELKRFKKALSGKYKDKPTTQSAYVVGDGHIKIDGRYYDAATSGITGTTATVVNIGRPAAAVYSTAEGGTVVTAGGGSGSGGTTIIGGTGGAPVNASYLVIAPDSTLTAERSLLVSTALTMTDTGPNNALTIGMATPQSLSATSTNVNTLGHAHAVLASAAPGANEALLKSDGNGALTLVTVTATEKLRSPLLDSASGGITISPADSTAIINATTTVNGSILARSSSQTDISATTAATSAVSTLGFYRARGSIGSPSAVQNGDPLGLITFGGYHSGGAYSTVSAHISAFAAENHTSSARGGALAVFTAANSSTSPTERQRWHNNGNVTIGTSTDGGYKLDVSGTMRASTSVTTASVITPSITTASNVDLVINPAGTGAVQFPNDQTLRTSDFDSSFPIEGWQINEVAGVSGYSALTIGKIQADELAVRVFVADEVRVDRGDEYWTKSYGIIAANFTTPSSIGGTVSVMFEDSPALTGAIFTNNDWVLIRKLEIDSGLTLFNVWGQVSSYVNNSDGTQNWTFTLRSGPTSEAITKGSLAIDFGASGAALIHLSVIDASGAPYIKMRRWSGGNPYTPSNYTTYVQLGNLGSIGNSYYTPSGDGIYIRSTAAEDQFIVADNNGLQLRGASLTLWNGSTQTVNIGNTGTDVWLGTGSSNKILNWNGSVLSLRANNADVITLDTSGNSYFSGVMTIGSSGEIRQGTGAIGTNYTGLRIWRDSSIGRIAGYNNNVQQWYANTDGKLYAGGGTFMADADGIHLGNESYAKGFQLYRSSTFSNSQKAGGLWALSDLGNYVYLYAGRSTGLGDAANATGRLSLIAFNSSGGELSLVIDASSNYATVTGLLRTDTVRPTATNTYDLGTSSFYYNNAYIRNLHIDTIVGTPSYSHSHAASEITSGTLDLARIPSTLTGKSADFLDGLTSADFALAGHSHGTAVTSITGGTGISVSGTTSVTISHADTSSLSSVDNSGGTVIQDLTVDGFGHATAASSINLDLRYALITDLANYVPTSRTVTAGAGLTGGGALSADITISHADTSSVTSADNSGTTFIQDLTFDTYGHVTGIVSADAATALDARYVNVTGDTMTGALVMNNTTIGDLAGLWSISAGGVLSMAANTDVNHTLGRAIVGYGAASDSATFAHYDHHTVTNFGFAQYANGATQVNAVTGQEVSLSVNDVATVSVTADRLLPRGNTLVHIGDYNRKFGEINATVLKVQQLVAQEVISTIGGQIVVAPTNELIADVSASGVVGGTDVIYTNMVAYWSLDQANGTRLDSKGTNHLSDRNTVTSTTGKVGTAAVFDKANSERLNIADNADLSVGDIDFYMSCWIYPTLDDASTQVIASKGGASGDRAWVLQLNWAGSNNRVEFVVYNSSNATTQVNSGALTVNSWYFVEAWHNASTNQIGVAVNTTETTASHTTGVKNDTSNFTLGALNTGSNYTGRIDEFGFWKNYIPNGTRRTFLYNSGNGRSFTDIYDYGAGAFSLDLKYNSYVSGEFIQMFSAPGGVQQREVFQLTSGYTVITGGFRYSAVRNLNTGEGGPFNWYAGDAVTSLASAVGSGFINMTATSTIVGHDGPVTAYYVRTGMGAWNAVAPVVADGNLRSFVDYTDDQFGHAAGNDLLLTPELGFKGYTIDTINGMRTFNLDIALYEAEVPFLNIGTVSGIDIEINTFENNDNRSISFNSAGDERSYIKGFIYGSSYNTLQLLTSSVTGLSSDLRLYSYAPSSQIAQITLLTKQNGTQGALATLQTLADSSTKITLDADTVSISSSLVGVGASNISGFQVSAAVSETARVGANVRMGTVSNDPAIIFESGTSVQWEIKSGADFVVSKLGTGEILHLRPNTGTSDFNLNISMGGDIDLNGNDITDVGTLALTSTAQTVLRFSQNNWYLGAISNTDPLINFDSTDYMTYSRSSNSFALYIGAASRLLIDANNMGIGGASYGGGAGVLFMANRATAPTTNPSGGGILYVESGALRYRGSSGTVTTIAVA